MATTYEQLSTDPKVCTLAAYTVNRLLGEEITPRDVQRNRDRAFRNGNIDKFLAYGLALLSYKVHQANDKK